MNFGAEIERIRCVRFVSKQADGARQVRLGSLRGPGLQQSRSQIDSRLRECGIERHGAFKAGLRRFGIAERGVRFAERILSVGGLRTQPDSLAELRDGFRPLPVLHQETPQQQARIDVPRILLDQVAQQNHRLWPLAAGNQLPGGIHGRTPGGHLGGQQRPVHDRDP